MVVCPKFEKCLVYLTYVLVAATSIICSHQIRCSDKCWNWIYVPYFLITINSLAKLFEVDEVTDSEYGSDPRTKRRSSSGGGRCSKCCSKKNKSREKNSNHSNQCGTDFQNARSSRSCKSLVSTATKNVYSDDRSCGMPGWSLVDDLTFFLTTLLSLPCLLTQFLICSDSDCTFAYVPLLLSCFPLMVYLIDNVRENSMMDILVIGNVIFLSAYSTKYNSPYGIASAIIFAIIHFILKPIRCADYTKEVFYNFAIALFCVTCLYTLSGQCFFTTCEWLEMFTGSLKFCKG